MMFTGEDKQAFQTLVGNCTITPQIQKTSKLILNAIQTTIKEGEHFWSYHNELVSDLQQKQDEPIHSLYKYSIRHFNNCHFCNAMGQRNPEKSSSYNTVKYHEARDWVCLQDQSALTYSVLLSHSRTLEDTVQTVPKGK